MRRSLTLALLALSALPWAAEATDHYSFELEERLTPLIEWRDYGPAAFDEAIQKNKPIFMLLTAPSWCYWCQVYGSDEYLYNDQVYPYINKNFIPVYVDADKRQDLTRQYLEGGWPSTTVMAPNRERIYGFSGPRPIPTMLENMRRAVVYVENQGFASIAQGTIYIPRPAIIPTITQLTSLKQTYLQRAQNSFDPEHGGFGQGKKFPQPRTLLAFLDQYEETGDKSWIQMVETTLENQYTKIEEIETNYNLFDPVEGGFHRYGTARDWTPPHYEKMLDDNARLLQVYATLEDLNGNPLAREVTKKTLALLKSWYDKENGGFAGNSDAFDEHHYFGKADRGAEKPRIEWTKYTDWNSDAIIAFFDVAERRDDASAQRMAEESLKFFLEEMVDEAGPYHYMTTDGERGVQGNLLDSAALLLTSIEGYRASKDASSAGRRVMLSGDRSTSTKLSTGSAEGVDEASQRPSAQHDTQLAFFLQGAKGIADYALENLYDWHGGGFFERNSKNIDLYAASELVVTDIPPEENGMIAYALLLLFEETDDVRYLNAAVKTVGRIMNRVPSLDRGYFLFQAAKYMESNDTLSTFAEYAEEIKEVDAEGQASFFLTQKRSALTISAKAEFVPFAEESTLKGPFLLLLLIALIAGLLSFLSPCTLPILPAYFAAMLKTDPKKQIVMSISFLAGLALVFSLLGMSATVIGSFLKGHLTIFTQVIGVVMMGFGVMTLMGKGFGGLNFTKYVTLRRPRTLLRDGSSLRSEPPQDDVRGRLEAPLSTCISSFLFGSAIGLSWTPCVGPILIALLALASTLDSALKGGVLLLLYALGLGMPLILFSSLLQRLPRDGKLWRTLNGKWTSVVAGLIFVLFGFLIFSGTLTIFNRYVTGTGFQKWFFGIEEWLLELL